MESRGVGVSLGHRKGVQSDANNNGMGGHGTWIKDEN